MEISIPDELRRFVSNGVESGRFRSEDEAIAEGLRLLQHHEERVAALRADLQIGIDELNAGQGIAVDIADIKARGRDRLQRQSDHSA